MSNTHDNGSHDKDLEKLGQAYTRLTQEEPPELLDQAVLNSAHRAVEKKPHWMKFSWEHGLATAAVFVLAFSLVLNQREPVPDYEGGIRVEEAEPAQPEAKLKKQPAGLSADSPRAQREKAEVRRDSGQVQRMAKPAVPGPEPATTSAGEARSAEVMKSSFAPESGTVVPGEADEDSREIIGTLDDRAVQTEGLSAGMAESEAGDVASPPIVAEPPAAALFEIQATAKRDPDLEKKIQAIIELKRSGDPGWQAELASFKESYPGYPLPEELNN